MSKVLPQWISTFCVIAIKTPAAFLSNKIIFKFTYKIKQIRIARKISEKEE